LKTREAKAMASALGVTTTKLNVKASYAG